MKFDGKVKYVESENGESLNETKVCHFEFLGKGSKEFVFLDLTNPPNYSENFVTRFLGIAEIQVDETYKTPWVYLGDELGNDLAGEAKDSGARITFSIVAFPGNEIIINGEWIDFELNSYPFKGTLTRVNS